MARNSQTLFYERFRELSRAPRPKPPPRRHLVQAHFPNAPPPVAERRSPWRPPKSYPLLQIVIEHRRSTFARQTGTALESAPFTAAPQQGLDVQFLQILSH